MLNETEQQCRQTNTKMFASQMTVESLRVTLMSVLDIIDIMHSKGVPYVLTAKLNQDPLEVISFFLNFHRPRAVQLNKFVISSYKYIIRTKFFPALFWCGSNIRRR